jgi:hypothetical protein
MYLLGVVLGSDAAPGFQKDVSMMKIANKNNETDIGPVALPLPLVARMLPFGCPSAASMLPACCLQIAELLP